MAKPKIVFLMSKWLSPLGLLIAMFSFANAQNPTTPSGWKYEVIRSGSGKSLSRQSAALTHNKLTTEGGKVLSSTYAIGVPDYQVVSELSAEFQEACTLMKAGARYVFQIPVEDFPRADQLQLTGETVTWEIEILEVLPPKPDVAKKVIGVYRQSGLDAAHQKFLALSKEPSKDVYFGEWEVNQLGYFFLQQGKEQAAIDVLAFNVRQHPNSANAHDSLGEAYYKAGEHNKAKKHYRRSLQLNPNNKNAQEMLEKL